MDPVWSPTLRFEDDVPLQDDVGIEISRLNITGLPRGS